MTDDKLTTWNEWIGDWGTYLDEKVNIYNSKREPVELLGGLMWPDATIADLDPKGCEFAVKDATTAWVEIGNWEHQLTKAHVYYVAYPISSDWEGETLDDAPADECDFNRSEGVLIHASKGTNYHCRYSDALYEAFNSHCEQRWAAGDCRCWLLAEEAYWAADDFDNGDDPATRDVIEVHPFKATP